MKYEIGKLYILKGYYTLIFPNIITAGIYLGMGSSTGYRATINVLHWPYLPIGGMFLLTDIIHNDLSLGTTLGIIYKNKTGWVNDINNQFIFEEYTGKIIIQEQP